MRDRDAEPVDYRFAVDYESARERITQLAETEQNPVVREKAGVLLESFRDRDRF